MAKILIIEDDPLIQRLYQKAFGFGGHEVLTASDGREGLVKAEKSNPTLVLLDIMMPRMNGLEVLERLKAKTETRKIPVVILTNLAGAQDAEAALAKGAVKYLVKSEYTPKQVVDIVEGVLAGYTRGEVPRVGGR